VDTGDVLLGITQYSVRIMGLINFSPLYCIVLQAIWCLNFETWQNLGKQFAVASPLQIMGDSFPVPPWFTPVVAATHTYDVCCMHIPDIQVGRCRTTTLKNNTFEQNQETKTSLNTINRYSKLDTYTHRHAHTQRVKHRQIKAHNNQTTQQAATTRCQSA